MPNFRIVPRNLHDDATLGSTVTPTADFPVTNTQNTIRGRVFQVSGGASVTIAGTLPASCSATFFGMFNHRCHGGSFEVKLYTDAAWSSLAYSSGALPVNGPTSTEPFDWGVNDNDPLVTSTPAWTWFNETTFQSYRVVLTGTPSSGVWEVSRLWLGKHFETFINPAWGASIGFASDTSKSRSRGGSLRTNRGAKWKTMSFDFEWIPEGDRAAWLQIMEYCGLDRDVVVSLFPEEDSIRERDNVMMGKFTAIDPIARSNYAYLSKKIQVEAC